VRLKQRVRCWWNDGNEENPYFWRIARKRQRNIGENMQLRASRSGHPMLKPVSETVEGAAAVATDTNQATRC